MKTSSIIICAAAVVLSSACSKQEFTAETVNVNGPRITASMPQTVDTRISYTEESKKLNLKWEVGDSIYVFNKKADYTIDNKVPQISNYNRVLYKVTAVDASGKATFAPVAGSDLSVFDSTSKVYYACNVGQSASTPRDFLYDTDVITTVFASNSSPTLPNEVSSMLFNMVAKATMDASGNVNFQFQPVGCMVKVVIPEGVEVYKMRVNSYWVNNKWIGEHSMSTYYQVNLAEDGTIASGTRTNGSKTGGALNIAYTNTQDNVVCQMKPGTYYLPLCGDGNARMKGFTVWYNQGLSDSYTWTFYTGQETDFQLMERGKVYDLGAITAKPE